MTRVDSSLLCVTIDKAPTRSPYSENDLENELETKKDMPDSANRRTAMPSCSIPNAKPW